jgi:hypothetical protein
MPQNPSVVQEHGISLRLRDIISGGGMSLIRLHVHAAKKEVQYEAKIDHLRHSRFARLRDDKDLKDVHKESRFASLKITCSIAFTH